MSQITYQYPAMLAHVGEMRTHNASLRSIGSTIGTEQAALAANWQGDTGMTANQWLSQWNQAQEELAQRHNNLVEIHEQNTMNMMNYDQNEAAKWV